MTIKIALLLLLFCLAHSKIALYSSQSNAKCAVAYCAKCAVSTKCDACNAQYYLKNNTCLRCSNAIYNCITCSFSTRSNQVFCYECAVGSYLKDFKICRFCSDDVTNCLTCSNDGTATTCTVCKNGFFLSGPNTCTTCGDNIKDCVSCDPIPVAPFAVCKLCIPNSIVDNTGACVACSLYIDFCSTCNQVAKTCDTCADGFFRKNSGNNCSPCTDLVINCASCVALDNAGSSITCTRCKDDTFLAANACVTCGNFIAGCTKCNQKNKTCDSCSVGTFRFGGGVSCKSCDAKVRNCAACAATDDAGLSVVCSKCYSNFILRSNACVTCEDFIFNCTKCNPINNTCDTCSVVYYRFGSGVSCKLCIGAIPNCATCDATDDAGLNVVCSKCLTDFFPKANICVNCSTFITSCTTCNNGNNTCDVCAAGNFRDAKGTQCSTCDSRITGCATCAAIGDTATTVTCSACTAGLYLLNNQCVACSLYVNNCIICNQVTKTCDTCADGFFRRNSGTNCAPCTDLVSNCASCVAINDAGSYITCTKCKNNTFLVTNTCITCENLVTACISCNPNNKTCDTCTVGYFRFGSGVSCKLCDTKVNNCAACNATDDAGFNVVCSKCLANFILRSNACVTCDDLIFNCTKCNPINNTCDTCSVGYYRFGSGIECNLCTGSIPSCATCDATDDAGLNVVCSKCLTDFFLKANTCVTCGLFITACTTCNNGNSTCDVCAAGNFRDAQGTRCSTCDSRITGCATCAATDDTATTVTCSACNNGLQLLNNKCIACGSLITGCTVCNPSNSTCDSCAVGAYRKDHGKVCDLCNNVITSCTECKALDDAGSQVVCTKCAPNTITVGNTCRPCSQYISFCDICNTATSTCATCSVGFFRKNSGQSCSPCTDYVNFCSKCVSIDDAGTGITCSACRPNTFLVGNTCKTCSSFITNCKNCSSQTKCLNCTDKFYLSKAGDVCKPCSDIPFCLTCRNNGQDEPSCLTCGSGLVVDKDNFCVLCGLIITYCELCAQTSSLDVTCTRCIDGKVLSDDGLTCNDKSISTIIIIAAAGVAVVALLVACYFFYKRMKKRYNRVKKGDEASNITLL